MNISAKSIRAFIGCRNYDLSRAFYRDLGFEEIITSENMSYFRVGAFGFYLQDAYVRDWVDNSMVFLEVDHLEDHLKAVKALGLTENGEGKSRRVAEQDAARRMLAALKSSDEPGGPLHS